jgi:hypothetical protein
MRRYSKCVSVVRTVGFKHIYWDVSHRGVVCKALEAWALSGLKTYKCLLRREARPRH